MKLYNTLTRTVEDFTAPNGNKINMFVCGPTVYDFAHIGNAKTYTQMDLLARTLRILGFDVFYLQNITDIDDKIIARAHERGIDWRELSTTYEAEYLADMKALGNDAVTKYARATDYIEDIIRQVETLLNKGFAYKIEDGIYFEIAKFTEYGKLSGRREVKKDDAQTRIDHAAEKRGWNDFCLWKFEQPGDPSWPAPFGSGRPGWHIEDTAITEHHFGAQYDIHGGAIDLIFPHHEAELTQMESASGKSPFVRFWTHVGFLNVNNEKMSKSLGNFFTIRDVIEKGYDPLALRLLLLQSHYRAPISFGWDQLDAATNRLNVYRAMATRRYQVRADQEQCGVHAAELDDFWQTIIAALSEDLNAAKAFATLSSLETAISTNGLALSALQTFEKLLQKLDALFGLQLATVPDISSKHYHLIAQREQARAAKDWANSDMVRDQLLEHGIELLDSTNGTYWRWK